MPRLFLLLALALLPLLLGCQPAGDPVVQLAHAIKQAKANEVFPREIDEHTQLVDIEVGTEGREVIYLCEFHGLTDEEALAGRDAMLETSRQQAGQAKAEWKFFRDHKIPLTYVYHNAEGKEVMRYSIEPWKL